MKKIFIIAEIGINHNGDINLAKKIIEKSKMCGADAVKFQKRDINLVYSKKELDAPRASPFGKTNRDQKMAIEFKKKEYDEINDYCSKVGIEWFASAWDLIDKTFLREVAKEKKYTFISTGMSSYEMIDKAVNIFKEEQCEYELMHCVSKYPFDAEFASLNLIKDMQERYKCKIGYSGHEASGLAITYGAVALGATSIERHITLERTMYGSDQAASLTISGFYEMVGGIRTLEKALSGQKNKEILNIEQEVAKKLRGHIKID
jgi:N-acetylneuraminate synthase